MSVDNRDASPGKPYFLLALFIILILASLFRFYGQDWDDGHYFHPDERFIATVMSDRISLPALSELGAIFDARNSPLNTRSDDDAGNPQEFAYGSLPFLVATAAGSTIELILGVDVLTYDKVGTFGRGLTAVVDLATIAVVVLFARKAFGEHAAIIAGFLAACSVILIQLAHFFTVDTWVTFFTIATLYACLYIAKDFDLKWTLVAAALGGAALATKVSVGVLGIPILVSMLVGVQQITDNRIDAARQFASRLAIAAIPTILVFAIFEPYAIWRPGPFFDDIRRQWEIVNGHFDIPFTRQFVGTISGINEIENLVIWGIAPAFGIASLIATCVGVYWAVSNRDARYILLLSWIIPYFYVIASSEARFLRYAAPLVPPLAIMVGDQLARWWHQSGPSWQTKFAPTLAISVVLMVTLGWAGAFMTVYSGTHPRVDASDWIYRNVEPGSTITHELWDDRLPVRLGAETGSIYEFKQLDLYADRPNDDAVNFIAGFLDEADYIVLASQRLSHSIPRLPWRYPVQSKYYRLLERESLGFELAYEATNYPRLGPFRFNTIRADESFSVYDHPPVRIFRKTEDLPRREIELRFAHAAAQPRIPTRQADDPTLRLPEPLAERGGNDTSEWSAGISGNAFVATVIWIFVLACLAFVGAPIVTHLLGSFSDSGIGFSVLAGLLGVGALTWVVWVYGYATFGFSLILFSTVVVRGIAWKFPGKPSGWIWRDSLRPKLRVVAGSHVTFLSAFLVVLGLRSLNPDLWHPIFGGEKAMETALINAILVTGEFPPHDPWFADGIMNYYYYGFFLLATIVNLTGIPVDLGFQLSLATIAGLFAAALYSLGSTLTAALMRTRRSTALIAGGAATAWLVMFTGNLRAVSEAFSNRSLSVGFWDSSRVVDFAITEFPYFSFLYGDVHPHLIAAPVLVFIIALGYAWVRNESRCDVRWVALWSVVTGVVGGALAVINLWDGPTAVVLILAAISFPFIHNRENWKKRLLLAGSSFAGSLLTGYLLFARFFTFYDEPTGGIERTSTGTSLSEWLVHFGGLLFPVTIFGGYLIFNVVHSSSWRPDLLMTGAGLAALTYLLGAIAINGLAVALPWFVVTGIAFASISALIIQMAASRNGETVWELSVFLIAPFIVAAGALMLVRPVAAISALLIAGFLAFYLQDRQRSGIALLTIVGASACGLILLTDLIFVADHLLNTQWERMNTVFKLWFQSWTLLGIVSAIALIWLTVKLTTWLRQMTFLRARNGDESWLAPCIAALLVLPLVLVLLAYPLLATSDRLDQRMESSPSLPSLSGYQWMHGGEIQNEVGDSIRFTGDLQAISWLKDNADGIPVILEASIGAYRGGGSRISSATGFPSVLGWESHQSQQRSGIEVAQRSAEIRELYQTTNLERKRYLLRKYAVDFVVVGDVERYTIVGGGQDWADPEYYSNSEGLEAFEELVGADLERVFDSDGTILYQVQQFETSGPSP
jgi:YYY domain-containing protein